MAQADVLLSDAKRRVEEDELALHRRGCELARQLSGATFPQMPPLMFHIAERALGDLCCVLLSGEQSIGSPSFAARFVGTSPGLPLRMLRDPGPGLLEGPNLRWVGNAKSVLKVDPFGCGPTTDGRRFLRPEDWTSQLVARFLYDGFDSHRFSTMLAHFGELVRNGLYEILLDSSAEIANLLAELYPARGRSAPTAHEAIFQMHLFAGLIRDNDTEVQLLARGGDLSLLEYVGFLLTETERLRQPAGGPVAQIDYQSISTTLQRADAEAAAAIIERICAVEVRFDDSSRREVRRFGNCLRVGGGIIGSELSSDALALMLLHEVAHLAHDDEDVADYVAARFLFREYVGAEGGGEWLKRALRAAFSFVQHCARRCELPFDPCSTNRRVISLPRREGEVAHATPQGRWDNMVSGILQQEMLSY